MRRLTLRTTLLVLAAALVAAGCGGGNSTADKQEYIKKNNEIQREVTAGISKIGGSDANAIETAQKEVDKAVDDLNDLDVPGDYESAHKKLVSAIEDMSDIMGDMATAIEKKDTEAMPAIQKRISTAQTQFQEAVTSMNKDRS